MQHDKFTGQDTRLGVACVIIVVILGSMAANSVMDCIFFGGYGWRGFGRDV